MSAGFESNPMETSKNNSFELEVDSRSNSIQSPTEKKTMKANFLLKQKKIRYYFPLAEYTINFLEKNDSFESEG